MRTGNIMTLLMMPNRNANRRLTSRCERPKAWPDKELQKISSLPATEPASVLH